jgi:hypothetical protein
MMPYLFAATARRYRTMALTTADGRRKKRRSEHLRVRR